MTGAQKSSRTTFLTYQSRPTKTPPHPKLQGYTLVQRLREVYKCVLKPQRAPFRDTPPFLVRSEFLTWRSTAILKSLYFRSLTLQFMFKVFTLIELHRDHSKYGYYICSCRKIITFSTDNVKLFFSILCFILVPCSVLQGLSIPARKQWAFTKPQRLQSSKWV